MSQVIGEAQLIRYLSSTSTSTSTSTSYPAFAPFTKRKPLVFMPIPVSRILAFSLKEWRNGHNRKAASCQSQQFFNSEQDNANAGTDPCQSSDQSPMSGLAQGKATVPSLFTAQNSATGLSIEDAAKLGLPSRNSSPSGRTGKPLIPQKTLRVAVDVDEVLGSFLSSLNTFIAERHSMEFNIAEYSVYDFMKVWRCSQAEANDRVHEFFESEHFKDGILPIPGAFETLSSLADFCDLVVVTSRQHVIKNQTVEWIDRHYAGIFTDVHFGNHFALEGEARPKSEICRAIGAQILIDDNPRYAVECARHGIEVLLFDHHDSYPWSKTPDGPVHPLITRVHTWEEVETNLFVRAFERK